MEHCFVLEMPWNNKNAFFSLHNSKIIIENDIKVRKAVNSHHSDGECLPFLFDKWMINWLWKLSHLLADGLIDSSFRSWIWFQRPGRPAERGPRLFMRRCWRRMHHPSALCCLKCREVVTTRHVCRCTRLNQPNHHLQKQHHIGFFSYSPAVR